MADAVSLRADLIGQAVHPAKLQAQFTFKSRDELIRHLLAYINLRPPPKPVRPLLFHGKQTRADS